MNDIAISAHGLRKDYGAKTAIDCVTVCIPEGGLIGLIGRNGSGKTTLMKLCAGLLEVNGGSLEVFGGAPMDNMDVLADIV
jgi:ABC-2 type transport system ATP-binding protein